MKKQGTIWILNHYASFMEIRHLEIAKEFVKGGFSCVIIASSFHHGFRKYLFEEEYREENREEGIDFVYLKTTPAYQTNGANRIFNMFSYNKLINKYSYQIAEHYGKPSYIIASSLHPLAWEIGAKMARKYSAKWIAEVKDLWPQQLIKVGGMSKYHPIVLFFTIIEKRAYRKSNAIVTSMPYAHKYICDQLGIPRDKVHWLANGISVDAVEASLKNVSISLATELSRFLEENWCCVYCGSLVESECVPFIVTSFAYLREYSDIKLAIIGDGHSIQKIKDTIEKLELQNQVRMFPRVKANAIPIILEKAKCCIAAHENNPLYEYGLSMCKLNDYLLSGKPTIFACEAKNVVQEAGGISIPYGNPELLAKKIAEVYNMTEKELENIKKIEINEILKNYDYKAIGKKYLELLFKL